MALSWKPFMDTFFLFLGLFLSWNALFLGFINLYLQRNANAVFVCATGGKKIRGQTLVGNHVSMRLEEIDCISSASGWSTGFQSKEDFCAVPCTEWSFYDLTSKH